MNGQVSRPVATGLMLIGVCLFFALLLKPVFLTHWDSYLYTAAAVHFKPVPLAGGRWFFSAVYGLFWQLVKPLFGGDVSKAWQAFSLLSMILAAVNVLLVYAWAKRFASARAAVLAAAVWASGPLVAVHASAVMSETLAVTFLSASLLLLPCRRNHATYGKAGSCGRGLMRLGLGLWLRSALAGLLLGLAINVREPVVFFVPAILGLLIFFPQSPGAGSVPARLAACAAMVGGTAAVVVGGALLAGRFGGEQWPGIQQAWQAGMLRERGWVVHDAARMVMGNLCYLVVWLALVSPILVLAFPAAIRRCRDRQMQILLAGAGLYCLAQVLNHSLVWNPRFVMFAALVLILPTASAIEARWPKRWPIGVLVAAVVGFHLACTAAGWPILRRYHFDRSAQGRELCEALGRLPDQCIIAAGSFTSVVQYYVALHGRDRWRIVYSGWEWPKGKLSQVVDQALRAGETVYVADDPSAWSTPMRDYERQEVQQLKKQFPFGPGPGFLARLSLPNGSNCGR